jgi:lysophospholipase L1-like esterase
MPGFPRSLALGLLLAACSGSPPAKGPAKARPLPTLEVPADHVQVRLTGRSDQRDEKKPVFSYSGVQLELAFEAQAVSIELGDRSSTDPKSSNHYQVVIDGKLGRELAVTPRQERYELASGLGPGPHHVVLHRLTESHVGKTAFHGFVLHGQGARVLELPPRPARKLEIVGDSITCGYGNELSIAAPPKGNPSTGFTAQNENHYLSYGALSARALGAELSTICFSGKGVSRDYDGNAENQMPELFTRTIPMEPEPGWNFARFQPDAVIVNLGSNDFGKGVPDQVTFTAAYEGFVAQLRELYPRAHLACLTGPTITDSWPAGEGRLSKLNAWISGVVERRRQGGDDNMSFLALTPQTAPYGEDWHPSLATHRKMAAELQAHLKKTLGW